MARDDVGVGMANLGEPSEDVLEQLLVGDIARSGVTDSSEPGDSVLE